jgi:hypothetical protein
MLGPVEAQLHALRVCVEHLSDRIDLVAPLRKRFLIGVLEGPDPARGIAIILLRKRIEQIHRHDFGEVIHVVAGHTAERCGSVDRHDLVEWNRGRPEQADLVTGERGIAANLRVHALDHRPDPGFQRL